MLASAGSSGAQGSDIGGAFGFSARVTLFGGAQPPQGPAPTVTLPAGGSATPITATAPSVTVRFGPAIIFSSGPLEVSTQGTTGAGGSVTSSSKVANVNTSGQEVFTAAAVSSTCTASEAGVNGSTTINGGKLRTSEGNPEVEGDDTVVDVPANPAPNTAIEGKLEGVGDSFRNVFNEQIKNRDGSITVNAVHQYLLGPTAVGDLFIGQSRCAATAAASSSPSPTRAGPATTMRSGGQAGSATTVPGGRSVAKTGTDVTPLVIYATAFVVAGVIILVPTARRRVRQADHLPRGRP